MIFSRMWNNFIGFIDELCKIPTSLKKAVRTLKKDYRKAAALKRLWRDGRYSRAKALLIKKVGRILKEISPRKGGISVTYGAKDPYETARITNVYLLFSPILAGFTDFEPAFGEEVLEGSAHIRGRVRLIFLLEGGLRIFFNKKLRFLYKKTREILEV